MIKDEQLSDEAVEAAARAIVIANGGDPDAFLRLTIHKTTIKAWQQVVPLARAALIAGLAAWPGACKEKFAPWSSEHQLILPLPQENNNGSD